MHPVVGQKADDAVPPAVDGVGCLIERGRLLFACQIGSELSSRAPRVNLEASLLAGLIELGVVVPP